MSIYTYDPTEFMPIFDEQQKLLNLDEFISYKLKRTAKITARNLMGTVVTISKALRRAYRVLEAERYPATY